MAAPPGIPDLAPVGQRPGTKQIYPSSGRSGQPRDQENLEPSASRGPTLEKGGGPAGAA